MAKPANMAAAKDYNDTKAAVTQTAQEITAILSGYIVSGELASQAARSESSAKLATARTDLLAEVLQLVRSTVTEHDGLSKHSSRGPRTLSRSVSVTRASLTLKCALGTREPKGTELRGGVAAACVHVRARMRACVDSSFAHNSIAGNYIAVLG